MKTQELRIKNKEYRLEYVQNDERTLLFCCTYKDESNFDVENMLSEELIGWCFGRDYELTKAFIQSMYNGGNVYHNTDDKIVEYGNIKIYGIYVIYRGYWFTQMKVNDGMFGYALRYGNDLVRWGADEITDVLDCVEKDLDKYIKENL